MAKVQNTFIKSKMNRDLDARIIPNGEYRFAENIQISKSEGDDVGSIENVLGNIQILDIDNFSNAGALKCIGHFANELDSTVYLFLTNNQNRFSRRCTFLGKK